MKRYILFIGSIVFGLYNFSFANTGPLSVDSNGGVSFKKESLLGENVSVQKENITIQVLSGKQLENTKSNKYGGLEYLYKLIGEKGINKSLLDNLFWDFNTGRDLYSIMLYKIPNSFNYSGFVNFEIEYELRNESNRRIRNQLAGFSSLKVDEYNVYQIAENFNFDYYECKKNEKKDCSFNLKNLLFFYPFDKYPQELEVNFGNNKINVFDKYIVEDLNTSLNLTFGKGNKDESKIKTYLFKKTPSFYLSFEPKETKILKINYKIPLTSSNYSKDYGLVYNFEPIFSRRNEELNELNIKVIGDENHILNSNLSNFVSNKNKSSKNIKFNNPRKDIYKARLTGLQKNNIKGLKLSFNSSKDLLGNDFCGLGVINSDFFCGENSNFNYETDVVKKTNSPYYIRIKKENNEDIYKVFNVLK